MRIGVIFPEREGPMGTDLGAIREFVEEAESMGYDHLRTGEHVLGANTASRPEWQGPYGHTDLWHEPLVLFGYLAALTRKLEFATSILILPQRQAVLVAKQASALDFLSGGRLRLGIGVGWNDVEYEALGENFHDRGRRCEEQMKVMRALWTRELVTFEGRWHRIADAGLNPMPVQRPIPIWIGGGPGAVRSSKQAGDRVLRRIARMADGWFPTGALKAETPEIVARLREYMRQEGRAASQVGIEGSVAIADTTPEEWNRQAAGWREVGATHLAVSTAGAGFSSPAQHIEAMVRFKEAVADALG